VFLTHSLSSEEEKEIYPFQLERGRVMDLQIGWEKSMCSVYIPAFSGPPGQLQSQKLLKTVLQVFVPPFQQ
jgi:hypothetical protein